MTITEHHLKSGLNRTKRPAVGDKLNHLRPYRNSPEGVSYSVLEVDKIVLVDLEQVPAVEIQISFPQNIPQFLLFSLLFVLSVANEGSDVRDLRHQQSRFSCGRNVYQTHDIPHPLTQLKRKQLSLRGNSGGLL